MNSDVVLERISAQLDTLTRLFVSAAFSERTMKEKVIMLNAAGIPPREIADILGTTSNTVNVTLSQHRKKSKRQVK